MKRRFIQLATLATLLLGSGAAMAAADCCCCDTLAECCMQMLDCCMSVHQRMGDVPVMQA